MNIFMLDRNPIVAARMLDDIRVVKMITESAQMLSTAHRILDGKKIMVTIANKNKVHWELPEPSETNLYKVTHRNHPCNIWIRESTENYRWLFDHFVSLAEEYTFRYGKSHKSSFLIPYVRDYPKNLKYGGFTFPALAMPDKYKFLDFVESYRLYFNNEKLFPKKKPASWRNRNIPYWIDEKRLSSQV